MSSRAILPMRPAHGPVEMILEIESQQDELLRRLDELNARIEQALAEAAPKAVPVRSDRIHAVALPTGMPR